MDDDHDNITKATNDCSGRRIVLINPTDGEPKQSVEALRHFAVAPRLHVTENTPGIQLRGSLFLLWTIYANRFTIGLCSQHCTVLNGLSSSPLEGCYRIQSKHLEAFLHCPWFSGKEPPRQKGATTANNMDVPFNRQQSVAFSFFGTSLCLSRRHSSSPMCVICLSVSLILSNTQCSSTRRT